MNPEQLQQQLRISFAQHTDPIRAQWQQNYMKSCIPFYGVAVPVVKKICKPLFKQSPPTNNEEYRTTLRYLFVHATHREQWYAALIWARMFPKYITTQNIDLYVEIIRLGQWWDVIDEIAPNLIGKALLQHPDLTRYTHIWIADENFWVRRTALLTQKTYKKNTDFALLSKLILHVAHEKEFFIRKAIGWALREYSKINPTLVQEFITTHQHLLSPLSVREGLKRIYKRGPIF